MSTYDETKPAMLSRGIALMERFCAANQLAVPRVITVEPAAWYFGVCAYYRKVEIQICVPKCAGVGYAGMQWSFPGHSVDRTPYGVIAHELGHHVDVVNGQGRIGPYWSDFSERMRELSGEEPLTSYCPNDAEWFAEMFRLFVTNPDLLRALKPRTHEALITKGFKPVFDDDWRARLHGAPDRTIVSIERKLAKPAKRSRQQKEEAPCQQQTIL